jgi:hypothetical protein
MNSLDKIKMHLAIGQSLEDSSHTHSHDFFLQDALTRLPKYRQAISHLCEIVDDYSRKLGAIEHRHAYGEPYFLPTNDLLDEVIENVAHILDDKNG